MHPTPPHSKFKLTFFNIIPLFYRHEFTPNSPDVVAGNANLYDILQASISILDIQNKNKAV